MEKSQSQIIYEMYKSVHSIEVSWVKSVLEERLGETGEFDWEDNDGDKPIIAAYFLDEPTDCFVDRVFKKEGVWKIQLSPKESFAHLCLRIDDSDIFLSHLSYIIDYLPNK